MMKMKKMKPFYFVLFILFLSALYYFYPEQKLTSGEKIDHIKIMKSERLMILYKNGNPVARYSVSLGAPPPWFFMHPDGQKQMEGDYKTPEGNYTIDYKGKHQRYHRFLHISYPKIDQRREAKKKGMDPGGQILIHGPSPENRYFGKFMKWIDWTKGCIALTSAEVEEIYDAVPTGCSIEIQP